MSSCSSALRLEQRHERKLERIKAQANRPINNIDYGFSLDNFYNRPLYNPYWNRNNFYYNPGIRIKLNRRRHANNNINIRRNNNRRTTTSPVKPRVAPQRTQPSSRPTRPVKNKQTIKQ